MAVEFENRHALRAVLNGAARPVHPRGTVSACRSLPAGVGAYPRGREPGGQTVKMCVADE